MTAPSQELGPAAAWSSVACPGLFEVSARHQLQRRTFTEQAMRVRARAAIVQEHTWDNQGEHCICRSLQEVVMTALITH